LEKRVEQVLPGSGNLGVGGGGTMYTHGSKCKSNKIKGEEKKEKILKFIWKLIFLFCYIPIILDFV
jgi:hypothetical protein